MARKRYSDEDILKLLREIELNLSAGNDVVSSKHVAPCRTSRPSRTDSGRVASRPSSTATATLSSVCFAVSRTSAESPQGMTAWPSITSPPSTSRLQCATG